MLNRDTAEQIAAALVHRYGEMALAAAIYQAQLAAVGGETAKVGDWEQIALATERHLPH